ncbi:PstS family phosphate ABC transporter substrate-binding protein [Salipaludibacillus sp. HK11]|uniref:PstS family phosphate ABC transporter substrate-binding protein n=1 Tax=Salipaludibacillus sp. HK11 TaxID=3394320 RepID=UPI0039FC4B1C
MKLTTRIIYFIILSAMIAGAGYIGAIITAFAGGLQFYTPLVGVIAVFLIVLLFLILFSKLRKKTLKITTISFFSLVVVSVISYWSYNAYIDSLKMVTDRGIDLYDYQPFEDGTNVASLEEEASYHIADSLPTLDGATALYPVYSAFAQAVYPEREYDPHTIHNSEVVSTQTDVAYNRLIDGEVDIIFVAGPSTGQEGKADRAGVELELTPIGREAFVFFVNARNPVDELSIDEVRGIYSGEITNWTGVGGENEAIRAFQRPADSGSQTALENLMENYSLTEPPTEDVAGGMGGIISETADYHNHRNSLGYSFRYFSTEMVQNGDIKHLEIEGIYPDKESIADDSYPISSEFYIVTAGTENSHVDDFIEWILSEQGQKLVERSGYVPVN